MSKTTTAGSEVDAYCTKCKMDLNHRIIAMEGTTIKRVECLTCRGHHNYRLPKAAKKKTAKKRATRSTGARSAAAKAAAEQKKKDEQRATWEQAIMGRSTDDFVPYRMTDLFQEGQLIRHKKFGDGVVWEAMEGGKIAILFEAGPKTLVHGRSA
jgi:Zn ribbon nucleic-acid-binding protein